nr:MAG TPA: hypothetical protein [Caudoviricetes sp.]
MNIKYWRKPKINDSMRDGNLFLMKRINFE